MSNKFKENTKSKQMRSLRAAFFMRILSAVTITWAGETIMVGGIGCIIALKVNEKWYPWISIRTKT